MPVVTRPSRVEQVEVPEAARTLSRLHRIDYGDAFSVPLERSAEQSPEGWMRAIFDQAPLQLRMQLWSSWIALGLRLGSPWSGRRVLGWPIRESDAEHVLLGVDSRVGMPAELLLMRRPGGLLFDTFVQQDSGVARAVWRAVEPAHVRTVPVVLGLFLRRCRAAGA